MYIQPFPTTGARVRVSTTTGANPVWSEDGRLLYYNTLDKQITVVDVTSPLRPGLPKTLFHHEGDFGIGLSGQRMLLPSGGETRARPMTIVLNATAALRK